MHSAVYRIDRHDILRSVTDNRHHVPDADVVPALPEDDILGRPLWSFVSGVETRSYLNAIFFACRMGMRNFTSHYRCDGPLTKRFYRLSITPDASGGLILSHRLTLSERPEVDPKGTAFEDHYEGTRCSVCCAYLIGESWVDAFSCSDGRYFAKDYGICPDCKADVRRKLAVPHNAIHSLDQYDEFRPRSIARNPRINPSRR